MELLHPLFKWFHIFAGIMWIGLLYFFNFINGSFVATLDGDTKKKVIWLNVFQNLDLRISIKYIFINVKNNCKLDRINRKSLKSRG